jgi:hypothetical protein
LPKEKRDRELERKRNKTKNGFTLDAVHHALSEAHGKTHAPHGNMTGVGGVSLPEASPDTEEIL